MRVAVYCSGGHHEGQRGQEQHDQNKLHDQHEYAAQEASVYTQRINNTPGWTLAGVYVDVYAEPVAADSTVEVDEIAPTVETAHDEYHDECHDDGLQETQYRPEAVSRPQFQRMIEDCEAGLIDIIVCKSLSSFATNALDAITNIRKLKELGIRLIFDKEKIDTAEAKSEMFISIYAAFAQKEERSISLLSAYPLSALSAGNMTISGAWEEIDGRRLMGFIYGYRKNAEGTGYEPVPEEAAVIRKIFDLYEHGVSISQIVDELLKAGAKPPSFKKTGKERWDKERLYSIIQNEKYVGDLLCNKYYVAYTTDFKKRIEKLNDGTVPSRYIMNHHEAIISRKQFERCNVIFNLRKMRKRREKQHDEGQTQQNQQNQQTQQSQHDEWHRDENQRRNKNGFYPFGDFLRCPYCGHVLFQRRLCIQDGITHILCEGEGACREFVIVAAPVEKAVLDAWNNSLTVQILQSLQSLQSLHENDEPTDYIDEQYEPPYEPPYDENGENSDEIRKLLAAKEQYPTFDAVHYWWLDEFVKSIVFGQYSHTTQEIADFKKLFPDQDIDDRTIQISWKCGLISVMPSGIVQDNQNPRHKAKLWDAYLLKHPDKFPELTKEVEARQQLLEENTDTDADSNIYGDSLYGGLEDSDIQDELERLNDYYSDSGKKNDSRKKTKKTKKRTGRRI